MSDLPPDQCGHCKKDPAFDKPRDTAGRAEGEASLEAAYFPARFESKCSACGSKIAVGQYITKTGPSYFDPHKRAFSRTGARYEHMDCQDE